MKRYTIKRSEPAAGLARAAQYRISYDTLLNAEQLAVVTAGQGPVLVIAGAGSGKTRTVTFRVARLIEDGVPAQAILLLTFTNRAAREMMNRVDELLPGAARQVVGGTFHHVGNRILRRYGELLGYGMNFNILDPGDASEVMDTAVHELGIDTKRARFPKGDLLTTMVSKSIDSQTPIVDLIESDWPYFIDRADEIAAAARRFIERKRQMNAMDFDDLLLNWKILLTEHAEAAREVQRQFRFILVDEYQDTNFLQGELIDLMAAEHRNVTVVGDDAQSIYGFRGAHFENILKFPERYPDAKVAYLTHNYRSTPQILDLANRVIARNQRQFKKTLRAVRPPGELPAVVPCRDVYQQAAFVAERVLELRDEGFALNDMAVLYRAHSHALELQVELTRRRIPFIVRSGLRFFEQAHIKDVLAHLKLTYNPADELAFKRVARLQPGVGAKSADEIWNFLAPGPYDARLKSTGYREHVNKRAHAGWDRCRSLLLRLTAQSLQHAPGEMIRLVLTEGYKEHLRAQFPNPTERIEDLEQLMDFASRFESLETFLGELALVQSLSSEQVVVGAEPDEFLTLSSIHQAKGLEWRAVFLIWVADGRLPSAIALNEPDGEEEERRLFYVATTRAKDLLALTYPLFHHARDYEATLLAPSRFLDEAMADEKELGPAFEKWILEETDEAPAELPGINEAKALAGKPVDEDDVPF